MMSVYLHNAQLRKHSKKVADRFSTLNCGILVSWVGGSGDPRRKWKEMGERERERGREGEREREM